MDKIITVLGYKIFITEMSYAPDWLVVVFRLSPTSPNLSLKPNRFRLIGSRFEID